MKQLSGWSILLSLVLFSNSRPTPLRVKNVKELRSHLIVSPSTALDDYVNKKDTAFQWHIQENKVTDIGTYYYLKLVSQQWQHIAWQHHLAVFFPHQADYPETMLLALRHMEQKEQDLNNLQVIAEQTGSPCAILYGVPNQPLFGGKQEEELINFTFLEYLRTGDETWPLLFPMVKSVVRAMDALQELSKKENNPLVEGFMVTGHSKRAHTAWLTAAVDSRVKGIMPVAFDLLNSPAQITHHFQIFGKLSSSAQAGKDVLEQIGSPRGETLINMVDAYGYRKRLSLPKLIVLGTNDDYSPSDALNLYWEGLKGPKWILYLPNTDHAGASLAPAVNATAFAFFRAVASATPLPELQWQFEERDELLRVRIQTDSSARKAQLWSASAVSQDFRAIQWYAQPMKKSQKGNKSEIEFIAEIEKQEDKFTGVFGQIEYEQKGKKFILSTQIQIKKRSK